MAELSVIPTWIRSVETFVKAHERLVLIVAMSLVLWHYGDVVRSYFDNKHLAEQSQTNQQIAAVEARNEALLEKIGDMQKTFDQTVASLEAQIAAKKQAVIVQQKKDDALPPDALAQRWAELILLPAANITPQTSGSLNISPEAAHTTVNQLERIPQLDEEVADRKKELDACVDLSKQKDVSIASLQDNVRLEKEGRAADAKVAKDNQRKSFWKGTKFGSALTGIGLLIIKIAAH